MPQTSFQTNGCTPLTFSFVVVTMILAHCCALEEKQKRVEIHYIIRVTWSDRGLMCTATPRQRRRHQNCCDHPWRVLLHHVDSIIQYTSAHPIPTDAICSSNPTICCIPTCSWPATPTATSSIRLKRRPDATPNPSAFRRDTQRSVLSGLPPYAR
jgi:hypothetical protein